MNKMELTNVIHKAHEKGKTDSLITIIYDMLEWLKEHESNEYSNVKNLLMKSVYGEDCHMLDIEEAKEIVKNMKPCGEYFTMDKIGDIVKKYNIDMKEYTFTDFYTIMNMYYNDARAVLGNNVENYINMSLTFLEDVDAPNGASNKVYDYFKYVAKSDSFHEKMDNGMIK